MQISALIITLALITGQLIKIPIGVGSGVTIIDVTVITLCLLGLLKLKFKPGKPPVFIIAGLLFSLVALISLILSPLPLTPKDYLSSFSYNLRFLTYILLGWLLISKAFPNISKNILKILLFSGSFLSIVGLMQFIILPDLRFLSQFGWDPHFYRTVSTFLDPNFLGAFLVLTLLLIFQNELSLKNNYKIILFALVYLTLMTTFSRSGYLMFLVSFLSLALFKKSLKVAIFAVILFAGLLIFFQLYLKGVNQVTPLDRNQTASYRFTTWQQGFDMFSKSPLLGVGFNAYNLALKEYKLADQQFIAGHGATTNDSSLVYIASTTGITGLLVFLCFLLTLILKWKRKSVLAASVLGLLAHSIFVNSLFYPFILSWLILYTSNPDHGKNIN